MGDARRAAPPVRLVACMMTCAARTDMCAATVARYHESDLGAHVPLSLHMDGAGATPQERQVVAARATLQRALADDPAWTHLLFLEDDLLFAPHTYAALRAWPPLVTGAVALASLYRPPFLRVLSRGPGYECIAHDSAYGSQALLFSRACAEHVAAHWDEQGGMQDQRAFRLAARLGHPLYVHVPSLVQHQGVSTWGGPPHWATDFDAARALPGAQQTVPPPARSHEALMPLV